MATPEKPAAPDVAKSPEELKQDIKSQLNNLKKQVDASLAKKPQDRRMEEKRDEIDDLLKNIASNDATIDIRQVAEQLKALQEQIQGLTAEQVDNPMLYDLQNKLPGVPQGVFDAIKYFSDMQPNLLKQIGSFLKPNSLLGKLFFNIAGSNKVQLRFIESQIKSSLSEDAQKAYEKLDTAKKIQLLDGLRKDVREIEAVRIKKNNQPNINEFEEYVSELITDIPKDANFDDISNLIKERSTALKQEVSKRIPDQTPTTPPAAPTPAPTPAAAPTPAPAPAPTPKP